MSNLIKDMTERLPEANNVQRSEDRNTYTGDFENSEGTAYRFKLKRRLQEFNVRIEFIVNDRTWYSNTLNYYTPKESWEEIIALFEAVDKATWLRSEESRAEETEVLRKMFN